MPVGAVLLCADRRKDGRTEAETQQKIWRLNIVRNNKTFLNLQAKCPIFMSDFNQIWILSTDFHERS